MRRREFIAGLGGAAAWPVVALAQPAAMPVIGYLTSASSDLAAERAFRDGLREAGFEEGRNVAVIYRSSIGQDERLPVFVAELLRDRVNVVFANGVAAALAAKSATTLVPIVFSIGGDPIEVGLVPSLNRPQGNLTGVSTLNAQIVPKRLQLLHELLPNAKIVAALLNPTRPSIDRETDELHMAARILGVQLHILHASSDRDFDPAFSMMNTLGAQALLIGPGAFFTSRGTQLASLAARHTLPAIFQYRYFVEAGGLMSYGGNFNDTNRRAAVYVGRILRGEQPADLPVQQATKAELFINLRSAKALGLTIPETLLATADEVIE
jgi:ABC-type uncharacterized transport system substrate-binding protein